MTGVEASFDGSRDVSAILGTLSRGRADPSFQRTAEGLWVIGLSPQGGFSACLEQTAAGVALTGWGEGAGWVADHLPDWLGADDDLRGFRPEHDLIDRAWRRYGTTWRVPRTLLTWQIALAAVLEQRVTGVEARSAWRMLLIEHGSPAPGPAPGGMRVPPDPDAVLRIPSWDWRRYGVDRQRIRTIRELASAGHVLERAAHMPASQGRVALTVVPGVGPWTAAEISARAFGDADAVSVGDYHQARNVTYALTGETDGTDEDMLRLLAPYAGHRYRAVRMIELARVAPPRRGPRMRLPGPGQQ